MHLKERERERDSYSEKEATSVKQSETFWEIWKQHVKGVLPRKKQELIISCPRFPYMSHHQHGKNRCFCPSIQTRQGQNGLMATRLLSQLCARCIWVATMVKIAGCFVTPQEIAMVHTGPLHFPVFWYACVPCSNGKRAGHPPWKLRTTQAKRR